MNFSASELLTISGLPIASWGGFTSPVATPYPENAVHAQWFPANNSRRPCIAAATVTRPGNGHNALAQGFSKLGISLLRLSLPYHDFRIPRSCARRLGGVANVCRTNRPTRQGRHDILCCYVLAGGAGYENWERGDHLDPATLISPPRTIRGFRERFHHCSTYSPTWFGRPFHPAIGKVWRCSIGRRPAAGKALMAISPVITCRSSRLRKTKFALQRRHYDTTVSFRNIP